MIKNQVYKVVNLIEPAVYDNTSPTSRVIDLQGVDEVLVTLRLGTTDIGLTALKIQASDVKASDTSLTGAADVTGLVYGTSPDPYTGATSALPTATDDNKTYAFSFRAKEIGKRYAQLAVTVGDGTVGAALQAQAIVWEGAGPINTAASAGLAQVLIV